MADLSTWQTRPRPERITLEGRYCRLEPLDPARHGDALFDASMAPGAEERFRWLPDGPQDRASYQQWLERTARSEDPLFFAVIDRTSGRAEGRQALMRTTPEHGVIEIGNILWGPRMARTRIATEAFFLHARYAFDDLGYRRFEWKCNDLNQPSRNAAARFGFTFEGVFRQHMVVKGRNRDSAWFSMLDGEWPRIKAAYERWLDPDNFDREGRQRSALASFRSAV
ncbi:MAG TPA: GNAT family protein [Burkholderiales bacterium]|nr:GNAT family protein [Burkholderiales bacterium]